MSEPDVAPCAVGFCSAVGDWSRGWLVCARHGRTAGEELAALGGLFDALTAAPKTPTGGENVGGGSPKHEKSPVNLDVLVARDARSKARDEADPDGNTAPAVLAWTLAVAERVRLGRLGGTAARTVTFATSRARVAAHLDWVLAQDWAGSFVVELHGLSLAAERLAGIPRPRRSACRGCGSTGALRWDGQTASCGRCGGSWSGLAVLRSEG